MSLYSGTNKITIWDNKTIAKNASLLSDPVPLHKCGPNSKFWGDLTASGNCTISIQQLVKNSVNDTFYTPSCASQICASHICSTASRDRYSFSSAGGPWLAFKAYEMNASSGIIDFDLILAQD